MFSGLSAVQLLPLFGHMVFEASMNATTSKKGAKIELNKSILCVTDNFLFASACVIFLLGKFLGKPNIVSNQPSCRMSMKCCDCNSLRGSSDKIGTILC